MPNEPNPPLPATPTHLERMAALAASWDDPSNDIETEYKRTAAYADELHAKLAASEAAFVHVVREAGATDSAGELCASLALKYALALERITELLAAHPAEVEQARQEGYERGKAERRRHPIEVAQEFLDGKESK